ncbi:MAG: leucyl/phenylalanyl-tRNA--protein transferase [Chloroflexi bacterium]|nr:leucyl/phenylalanyl-tRNA--protein transferase [Chloroflexota bacterium]
MVYHNGIAILEHGDDFPDPRQGPTDDPVAIGFELTPDLMLNGYGKGLFAWSDNPVTWWSPDPRAIIDLDAFHVSRRLARKIKAHPFSVTVDLAFDQVVYRCSLPRRGGEATWISETFRRAFQELHAMGHAHSVECWQDDQLVGGVFGVAINGFFSAESMFHTATDASKIALFYLIELLRRAGFQLFDIQVLTPHTESLGGREISRNEYLGRLQRALAVEPSALSPTNKKWARFLFDNPLSRQS